MAELAEEKKRLEEIKKLANRHHQDIIQNVNFALADEVVAPDCIFHGPNRDARYSVRGPEQAKRIAISDSERMTKGFKFIHDPVIAEGNLVAFLWKLEGTTVRGQPPMSQGVDIIRLENGKIAEVWFASARPRFTEQSPIGWQW